MLDPILLALVQNQLDHICKQMGKIMSQTARSPILAQAHDFSCFIASPQGFVVSQADGIPIHTGSGGFSVRAILKDFDKNIFPEDIFLLNDPYEAGGNHLPDWLIAKPIFVQDNLVAFACNRAHQSDIGGGAAGTYNPEATEIFHEGIRLPVLKLSDQGNIREDLWKLLLINCRTPDLLDGDLRAMIGTVNIAGEHIINLADEIGLTVYLQYIEEILNYANKRFVTETLKLPDGEYYGEDSTDTDAFKPKKITVRLHLKIYKGTMTFDFSRSDLAVKSFKNSSLANTHSAVYTAISSFFDADLPRNEGSYRNVTIIAPEGTILHAKSPDPLTMCTIFPAHEIIHSCWQALGKALPSHSCAGWGRSIHGIMTGMQLDGKTPYVMHHGGVVAGGGAVKGRDGFNLIGHLCTLGGLVIPNLEVYEQSYPVHFIRQEFRQDCAGDGEFRGGTGAEYELNVMTPASYSFRGEGLANPSGYGVEGGTFGAKGNMVLTPKEQAPFNAPQYGLMELEPLNYRASSPGGGGWGNPLNRCVEKVFADIRDGILSAQKAKEVYGVVLNEKGDQIDVEQTQNLRQSIS